MNGPFHKQRQHFFWIFNTPLPHVGTFSLLFVGNFGQFLTPPPHVEHLGAHEIDFLKLSSKQIVISVLNRPIKSQYFMAWNWSTYWTSCVCLTFKPYKLHRELQYTCNWNRTRLFRIQSSEMQYVCTYKIYNVSLNDWVNCSCIVRIRREDERIAIMFAKKFICKKIYSDSTHVSVAIVWI